MSVEITFHHLLQHSHAKLCRNLSYCITEQGIYRGKYRICRGKYHGLYRLYHFQAYIGYLRYYLPR